MCRAAPRRATPAPRAAGFTLIEMVIAVGILAVAMGALVSAVGGQADQARALREKTLGMWVAHNRLTEIELEPNWPALGKAEGKVEMAGVRWHWRTTVSETPDPNVRRIDIAVAIEEQEGDAATLSSFLAKTGRT